MKASDLKSNTSGELQQQLLDLYHEQSQLRMQGRTGQVAHYNRFGELRRDIARVKTILTERKKQGSEK